MRRPLPEAARRRPVRAFVVLPLAFGVSAAASTNVHTQSIPCATASTTNLTNTLSSQACDACGGDSLCVYRSYGPSACAVDCVPTVPTATTWSIAWLKDQPNNQSAVTVASAAVNGEAPSTVVIHETVSRIDDQLTVPSTIIHFSLTGRQNSSPLMKFTLSDAMRTNFASLRAMDISNVDVSNWKTLPAMSNIRNLSLDNVNLDWWPLTAPLEKLEHLSLDNNNLVDMAANLQILPTSLRSLSLRFAGLTRIPATFANLTSLHDLSMDGNEIEDGTILALPPSIETLSLRGSVLHTIPDSVTSHPTLVALDLSNNPGIRLPANASLFPSKLWDLRVARCDLRSFPSALSAMPQLRILDISMNPLGDVDGALSTQLSGLTGLTCLDLSNTSRPRVPDAVATMTQLTHLAVASNSIVTVDATSLPPSLQHLNLAFNGKPLVLTLPATAASSLRLLNVSHCGLSSLALAQPLTALLTLDASGNTLASIPASLPSSLTFLNLSFNGLTTLPNALFQLSSLQHLDLRGNPIPPASVESLSPAQVTFFNGLQTLLVDPAIFKATDCIGSANSTVVSFGYRVCVDTGDYERRVNGTNSDAARARVNRNLYIVAITIGTALLLVTLVSLAMRRGRRGDAKQRQLMDAWPTELASDREMTDAEWRALQMWSFWDDEDVLRLRIPWDLIRDRQVIGSGQYSVLWLARVASQPVFLKALQPTAHRHRDADADGAVAAVASLIREIQVLRALRHPHIVRLVGVTWMNAPTDVQVAIEDMANGDLRGYLELSQPPAPPSRWRRDGFALRVALQIADALVFLHQCGIAHNDLRSRNVVLDDACNAKLTGFGRHVFVGPVQDENKHEEQDADEDPSSRYMAEAVATAVAATAERDHQVPPPSVDQTFLLDAGRWMAPEVLRRHLRSRRSSRIRAASTATSAASAAADVYAFGVLLLELDSFELPFAHVELDEDSLEEHDDLDGGRLPDALAPVAPGTHDSSDLRFSSMPSGHNSLLGGPLPHAQPMVTDRPPPPPTGATMNACEEKCELALLRRLADGSVRFELELAASCPATVRDLVLQCVDGRPERRPTMRAVRDALQAAAATQRRRSSTGSSGTAAVTNTTRSISVDSSSGRGRMGGRGGGDRRGSVAVATQTHAMEEEKLGGDNSSSADSDATTTFFVMQSSPAAPPRKNM